MEIKNIHTQKKYSLFSTLHNLAEWHLGRIGCSCEYFIRFLTRHSSHCITSLDLKSLQTVLILN